MATLALVTGGAGLIGSHLVDLLLQRGYDVRVLDNLAEPTHRGMKPDYLSPDIEFIRGDVRSVDDLSRALKDVELVFHQAAAGGFMPEFAEYFDSNCVGTARLLEVILERRAPVRKIVVASSIAVYGEGAYKCPAHGTVYPGMRSLRELEQRQWEQTCPLCGRQVDALATAEDKLISPEKPYSISKYAEERLALTFGRDYGIPAVALRYFLTYGPRQSPHNPYTGVCSIFSTRLMNDLPPVIYEDGLQTRDFIYVEDVARANLFVAECDRTEGEVFNVGTGKPTTILEIAQTLAELLDKPIQPELAGKFRPGEARHIYADTTRLEKLGFSASVSLEKGLRWYVDWLKSRGPVQELFSEAEKLLMRRGVVHQTGGS